MSPDHHPSHALLIDYAAGAMREAGAVVIASHLTLCPQCRQIVSMAEGIGGGLIDDLAPEALRQGALDATLRRLDEAVPAMPATPRYVDVPAPLAVYLDREMEALPWKRLTDGIWQHLLLTEQDGGKLRLYRIAPETALPEHGHGGQELTMILTGAYRDELGRFGAGDVADLSEEIVHRPVAEAAGECIALALNARPIRPTSLLARLVMPFLV